MLMQALMWTLFFFFSHFRFTFIVLVWIVDLFRWFVETVNAQASGFKVNVFEIFAMDLKTPQYGHNSHFDICVNRIYCVQIHIFSEQFTLINTCINTWQLRVKRIDRNTFHLKTFVMVKLEVSLHLIAYVWQLKIEWNKQNEKIC